jgi:hypothetical protein
MESLSQVPFYTIHGDYQYFATVTGDNPVWPRGTNLSGEPVYFLAASPLLTGNFTFNIDALNADLLLTSTEEVVISAEESNTTYWKKEYPVSTNTMSWQGSPVATDFSMNVSALKDEIDEIQKVLNFQQGTSTIEVMNTVTFKGRINGVPVEETRIYSMPMTLTTGSYSISNDLLSQSEGVTRSRSRLLVTGGLNILQILGIIAFVASLGLFFFVLGVKMKFQERDEATVRALMHYGLHTKYADFISRGSLDEKTQEAIRLASLEDMVNTAMDLNERVIFDEKSVIYFFVHTGILYFFKPGEEAGAGKKPSEEKKEPEDSGIPFFDE